MIISSINVTITRGGSFKPVLRIITPHMMITNRVFVGVWGRLVWAIHFRGGKSFIQYK